MLTNKRAQGKNDPRLTLMEDNCTICLNQHTDTDSYVTTCRHRFHRSCVSIWTNMSQTCPLCRDPIGRVSHGGIAITDAQRERIIASYKLFDMTVNPDLSGICITERRSMLASVTGTHSHTKHDLKFDGAPVYLLLKGFRYNRVTPPYPENLGFVFRVDDESTRSQLAALSCITSDYSLVRQATPLLRKNR
jgi:hypothetical protein